MKNNGLFFKCFIICLLFCNFGKAQTTKVNFLVVLPENGILQNSAIYLTGNFNGWTSKDEKYRMKRIDERHYKLKISLATDRKFFYTYTLCVLKNQEVKSNKNRIERRGFISVGQHQQVEDSIFAYELSEPKLTNYYQDCWLCDTVVLGIAAENMPSFGKHSSDLFVYLKECLRKEFSLVGKSARIFCLFIVNKNGKCCCQQIQIACDSDINPEIFHNILKEMPDWNPGRQHNQNLNVRQCLTFKIKNGELDKIESPIY